MKKKLFQFFRKSVVACVSDFASKGVKPLYGMISITIPKKFSKLKITDLAIGLGKAAKEFDLRFIGGDTNEGKELVLQVSLFGSAKKIVARKGAKTNDVIVTTGPFGYSLAGLKILLNKKKATLEFSKKNKKKFILTKLPTNQDIFEFAKTNRIDPLGLIFNGGEEYEIVATVNPVNISRIKSNAKVQKIPLFEIGYVTNGVGVMYKMGTKTIPIKDKGWLHFRS